MDIYRAIISAFVSAICLCIEYIPIHHYYMACIIQTSEAKKTLIIIKTKGHYVHNM